MEKRRQIVTEILILNKQALQSIADFSENL